MKENAAHSQSEPWVEMWRAAFGGLSCRASLPMVLVCTVDGQVVLGYWVGEGWGWWGIFTS